MLIVDNKGKIFDDRRNDKRIKENNKVEIDRRKSDRRIKEVKRKIEICDFIH